MRIPELLVPAGGKEQLRAAVANGADAVYMSGTAFNARLNAENFTESEIGHAIDFAHEYGVKVHITQNTLVRTDEMESAVMNAVRMYELGADALIVQDRGLSSILKKLIPDIRLHLSTQGTVYDTAGVREAERAGFDRVILARELSENEIRKICHDSDTEIEVFIHGAICICYSGQCHMSEFMGGRSGNRGVCAQSCRLPYDVLLDGKKIMAPAYPLSTADMNMLDNIQKLTDAGVSSLKIEGRMKSPEYVAVVTSAYRKCLDRIANENNAGKVENADRMRLRQIFSRGGFTDAYFRGESGKILMSDDIPKHQGIKIGELVSADRKRGHITVKLAAPLSNGDGIEIHVKSIENNGIESAGGIITYIKNKKGLLKTASAGMTVEVGDIPAVSKLSAERLVPGIAVYKTSDKALNEEARRSYLKLPQKIGVSFDFRGKTGEYAILTAVSEGDVSVSAEVTSQNLLEKAVNRPADEETVMHKLSKTGGTPYYLKNYNISLEDSPAISAAELNAMRREVLEKLTEKRLKHRVAGKVYISQDQFLPVSDSETVITLHFYKTTDTGQRIMEMLDKLPSSAGLRFNIPHDIALQPQIVEKAAASGVQLTAYLPVVTKPDYSGRPVLTEENITVLKDMCRQGILNGISISNASHLMYFTDESSEIRLYFEESMNLYNLNSVKTAKDCGMYCGVVSHELKPQDMAEFSKAADACEVTVWGRIPLMYTEHCPVGSSAAGGSTQKNKDSSIYCTEKDKKHYCLAGRFSLKDRKGGIFPLVTDNETCRCTVFSHKTVDSMDSLALLKKSGISHFRICIFDEPVNKIMRQIEYLS
jgi:putative protease